VAKIFVTRPIPETGIKMLRDKGYEVVINEAAKDRAATLDELKEGARGVDAILSILTDKITAEVMDTGLPTLKVVANYAAGFDNIDVGAAKQKNIMVTNTPGVLTETVAEHTFALMMAIAHRIAEADRFARAGKFTAWGPELFLGTDICHKILGIIGLGRIGSRCALHATKGFGMKVLYYDPQPNPDLEKEFGAIFVADIDQLLPQCDFVSIHVPLLYPVKSSEAGAKQFDGVNSTYHLINEERLKKMKPSAYLINTSRGPVVDEKALAQALKNGVIKGAALDVFEFEPDITPELKELDNVVLTPHIASATIGTRSKMAELAANNIIEALEGRTPPNLVK
jgi:glyoxylate reductase